MSTQPSPSSNPEIQNFVSKLLQVKPKFLLVYENGDIAKGALMCFLRLIPPLFLKLPTPSFIAFYIHILMFGAGMTSSTPHMIRL